MTDMDGPEEQKLRGIVPRTKCAKHVEVGSLHARLMRNGLRGRHDLQLSRSNDLRTSGILLDATCSMQHYTYNV